MKKPTKRKTKTATTKKKSGSIDTRVLKEHLLRSRRAPAQDALLRAQDPLPPVSPAASSIAAIEEVPPISSSIVRTKAGDSTSITMKEYGALEAAFKFLNARLFDGMLPDAMFNYTRKRRMLGHFAPDRYSGRVEEFKKPEIALNPDSFISRTDEQIVGTLGHEMVHLKQECFGKPSKRGYHNKEWASMMKAIGLMPSNTGAVGGKETGQQMDHYILPNGPFAQAFAELAATGWKLNLQSTIVAGGTKKPDESKTKFTCPVCEWIIRGKPDTKMVCKPCLVAQLSGMDWIDVNVAEELLTAIGRAEMVSEHAAVQPAESPAIASYEQQAAE